MLINKDNIQALKELEDNSIDSVVTDPPYGLSFMGKKWDYDVPSKELWFEVFRVLKPGGHLLSFGGSRTYHRLAVGIEDAGFEIRDQIMWVYGSGFPKSLNIGKAVDKLQGNERKIIGEKRTPDGKTWSERRPKGDITGYVGNGDIKKENTQGIETKGNSPYEGWGTALKPAHEPIVLARKPLGEKTVAKNVLKWGTGGINIDESRVKSNEQIETGRAGRSGASNFNASIGEKQPTHSARFPANLIHDGSEEVKESFSNQTERFFKSIIYTAKASKKERNAGCEGLEFETKVFRPGEGLGGQQIISKTKNNHPTVKPLKLMEYLIKLVTPKGGTVLDPFMGSGTTGIASKLEGFEFVGIELDKEYFKIAKARIENYKE